jgi:ATP-binding cassette subfamily B protein
MAKNKKKQVVDIEGIHVRNMTDKAIIIRLISYVKPFIPQLILAMCMVLLLVTLDLIGPLFIAEVLDSLGEDNINFTKIILIVIAYFATMIINAFLSYKQSMLLQITGQKIIFNIRKEVFGQIERFSISQFNKIPIGKLVTRVTSDTNTLNSLYTDVLINLFRNSLTIVGVFVIMAIKSPILTLYISVTVPMVAVASYVFRKFSRKAYRNVRYQVSGLNAYLSEHLSGMKLIQIFNREKKKYNEFKERSKKLRKGYSLSVLNFSIFRPLMYAIYMVALIIVFWYGSLLAIAGTISFGVLYAFTQYINKFFNPIQELAEQFDVLQSAFTSGERIFEIIDTQPEVLNTPEAIELKDLKGKIEFRNVWFAYLGEDWILKDVSFIVEPKETIAFVGATGSGKTTILSLIVRNYDIQKGQILIDDVDIRNIKIDSLRSQIGQMLQDVFLFSGTIASNIKLMDDEITDNEIVEASTYVGADRFIDRLPNKYGEIVRERGNNFSSGQRQLLSFARTVVHKPSIMILDEATANIDTETEILIQDSLKKMMNIGTMLIVAHRLSTIQHVNKIMVMQKGKIIESGSHQQLLRNKGHYYNLYRLQYDKKITVE